jgi:hypothetical protein
MPHKIVKEPGKNQDDMPKITAINPPTNPVAAIGRVSPTYDSYYTNNNKGNSHDPC